jgi:hypothetical protein
VIVDMMKCLLLLECHSSLPDSTAMKRILKRKNEIENHDERCQSIGQRVLFSMALHSLLALRNEVGKCP